MRLYNLAVSVNGIAVTVPTVLAATRVTPDVVYALTSQAYGAGLRKGTVGETAEFRIRPRDKYGNVRLTGRVVQVDLRLSLA